MDTGSNPKEPEEPIFLSVPEKTSTDSFEMIESTYKQCKHALESNENTFKHAADLTTLFRYLYTTITQKKDLQEKCLALENQMSTDGDRLNAAMKLTEADSDTINQLKEQIEHAWKIADAAHTREQTATDTIDMLRAQVDRLQKEVDMKEKIDMDISEELGQLSKTKEGFAREKERLLVEIEKLKQQVENALTYQQELERKNSDAGMKVNALNTLIEEQLQETHKVSKIKDRLEKEIFDLKEILEQKDVDITELNKNLNGSQKNAARLEVNLKEQRLANEKLMREAESIAMKLGKLQKDQEAVQAALEVATKAYAQQLSEYKLKEEENARLRFDVEKAQKLKDSVEKKLRLIEAGKGLLEEERDKLRSIITTMGKEIEMAKKHADNDKRHIDSISRERDVLNKTILRAQAVERDHLKLIKIQEQSKKKLEDEVGGLTVDVASHKKIISHLEKERDRLIEEGMDLTKKVEDGLDEIRLTKLEIFDYKKIIAETDNKLRQQQNLFDAIRADRNAFQKSLQESSSEVAELKSKLKISTHQTEQLKEDISVREQLLIKEEALLRRVTKEKENLRVEVQEGLDRVRQLKEEVSEMKREEVRLQNIIQEGDFMIRKQAKDLEQILNERDILGSQLVRRNDELGLLYEKLKILQTTLHNGEAQYGQRLDDIKLLKLEVKRLRQEKSLLTKSINNMNDLRQEVFHVERDLTRERLKCKALEEELQNPLNIHRWRKLEGSDPEVLELLQKVQILQKRILQVTAEGVERERRLKEAETLYFNLRQILSRQPGPDMQNQLTRTQRALAIRGTKMKCLVSELNMAEVHASEYKAELDKVILELAEMRKKYSDQKRLTRVLQQQLHLAEDAVSRSEPVAQSKSLKSIRTLGGGFKMSPVL